MDLILLPGLLCDGTVWAPQKDALSGNFRVTAWRHFYGHSSLGSMAHEVLAGAPPRFALAGHSMGGRVALEICRVAPERVNRLALFDTGATPPLPDEAQKRQTFIDIARTHGMAALAARWLPLIVHPARLGERAFVDALTDMVCRADPDIYAGQINALLNRPDYRPILPNISCPTLVACGRDDMWSPIAGHTEIAGAIPGAKLAIIDDCAHMATVEKPAEVIHLLQRWLQE